MAPDWGNSSAGCRRLAREPSVRLSELLDGIDGVTLITGDPATEILDVQLDTRLVGPGSLFCALRGALSDGHDFVADAVERGAACVMTDRAVTTELGIAAEVRVAPGRARSVTGELASKIVGDPSKDLFVVGITGTNGKTTVAHMVETILSAGAFDASVIGTLTGVRTTPSAPELQRRLAELLDHARSDDRPGAVAMEVSSHALDQERVAGVAFDVAVFTNLTEDHLDYHGTMDAYFDAKARLFEPGRARHAVIWSESQPGARLGQRRGDAQMVGWDDATDVEITPEGSRFSWRGESVHLPLVGSVNVINALLSLEVGVLAGIEPRTAARALASLVQVPGRMERVATTRAGAAVFVDYAHTPDALEQLLRQAREFAQSDHRVVVVFGCGGERDRAKRPLMGAVAVRYSDEVIITTDNPRSEDPSAITAEIKSGIVGFDAVHDIPDRAEALARALSLAGDGDVVVIAGKGHETTQAFSDRVVEFDDRAVVRSILGGDA
jgi:UDP-N-acetylmuramoyl-L-alanyl-D-glutamate--2,6-diaminopimelate ligase